MYKKFKIFIGAIFYDGIRFFKAVRRPRGWLTFCNRADDLLFEVEGDGVLCNWIFSRPLHFCDIIPLTGGILMKQAVKACPVWLSDCPESIRDDKVCMTREDMRGEPCLPQVSFLIGHRGEERLKHLLMTVRSIASQKGCSFECIVVEQDNVQRTKECLPSWVRIYMQPEGCSKPYCRSAAFNAAAREARGKLLILHDNDMLIPTCYAADAWAHYKKGYEVIQLKRFIFYLDEKTTQVSFEQKQIPSSRLQVERVIENLEAGGSLAISKQCFQEIGGMDEEFVGWGGEDNEFWDRCLTRRVWEYATLPIVHLWHESLSDRQLRTNPMMQLLREKLAISAESRIKTLRGASNDD